MPAWCASDVSSECPQHCLAHADTASTSPSLPETCPTYPQMLQREITRVRRSSMVLAYTSDLTLDCQIGRGGFSTVYGGTWRKAPAAVKARNGATACPLV